MTKNTPRSRRQAPGGHARGGDARRPAHRKRGHPGRGRPSGAPVAHRAPRTSPAQPSGQTAASSHSPQGTRDLQGGGWEPHGGPGAHRKGFGLRCRMRRLQAGPSRTPRHPATARPSQTLRTGPCQQTQASGSEKLSRGRAGDPERSGRAGLRQAGIPTSSGPWEPRGDFPGRGFFADKH